MNGGLLRAVRLGSRTGVARATSQWGYRGLSVSAPRCDDVHRVTLMPGDGIGPEIVSSVMGVFQAAKVPVEWSIHRPADGESTFKMDDALMSIARNQVCLKGPLHTKIGKTGDLSRNHVIRRSLNMFANVVPIKSRKGIPSRYDNVDFVIIRENTEGEYSGYEQHVTPGVVQSFKTITEWASLRIANYAFEYAVRNNRKKVTAIHKANIQKISDGEFLKACRAVAEKFPQIEYNEMIVDNMCMQLIMNPHQFEILLTPNLYGSISTNCGISLVGGPGVVPSATFGTRGDAIFEPGGRHVGYDIAGRDLANPLGMLFASVEMLRHLKLDQKANLIENSIDAVLSTGSKKSLTCDLGGNAKTSDFTEALIRRISESL